MSYILITFSLHVPASTIQSSLHWLIEKCAIVYIHIGKIDLKSKNLALNSLPLQNMAFEGYQFRNCDFTDTNNFSQTRYDWLFELAMYLDTNWNIE